MNELEMEIGRNFGATAFFIFQTIKFNPKSSVRDLEIETGLSMKQIKLHLKNMYDCGIVSKEQLFLKYCRGNVFTINEEKMWKLH